MTIFGIDISHHQQGINLQWVKNEGFQFVIARVGQGAGGRYGTTRDREWIRHRDECRRVGLKLCAYWYIGDGISPGENARLCETWMGDKSIPVALDCEEGSGDIPFYRSTLKAFSDRGLRVPLSYIPKWYWQRVGSPSLLNTPPLWSSRYVSGTGTAVNLYPGDGSNHWDGYGGNNIAIAQFTSSARVAGIPKVDANAFRGTLAQLDVLLFGAKPSVDPPKPEPVEREMQLTDIIGYNPEGKPITVGDALKAAMNPGVSKEELTSAVGLVTDRIKNTEGKLKDRINEVLFSTSSNSTWGELETKTWGELETSKWGKIN